MEMAGFFGCAAAFVSTGGREAECFGEARVARRGRACSTRGARAGERCVGGDWAVCTFCRSRGPLAFVVRAALAVSYPSAVSLT